MVVGYMGGSKRARNIPSIANNTNIFGIMGGTAPMTGVPLAHRSQRQQRATMRLVIPLKPAPGLRYMQGNNPGGRYMLSKNPQCSGGVGHTQYTFCKLSF